MFWKSAFVLQAKLAGAYDPNEDYSGKYMTAFYFKDSFGIPNCHCTHKYLAEQDDSKVSEIIATIDNYFKTEKPKVQSIWLFDKLSLFGKEKDCPVMERTEQGDMMLPLLQELHKYRTNDYPSYKPHVTLGDKIADLDMSMIRPYKMVPVAYALVSGDEKLKTWSLEHE